MSAMRISQLAERSGVPATTLRFYEGAGLLPAGRTAAGYRVYGEEAVERLRFIGAAKHLGLALDDIGELLHVWESGACAEVKAGLRPRVAARLDDAERRAAELTAFTATLHRALDHLDALPDRAARCGPECGFPAERWRAVPVACSLAEDGMARRAAAWREALVGAGRARIDDGVRLTVPVERTATVAELAAAEQRCCPFFDFRLHLDGPLLRLEVRAPADGTALLADLFGPVT